MSRSVVPKLSVIDLHLATQRSSFMTDMIGSNYALRHSRTSPVYVTDQAERSRRALRLCSVFCFKLS